MHLLLYAAIPETSSYLTPQHFFFGGFFFFCVLESKLTFSLSVQPALPFIWSGDALKRVCIVYPFRLGFRVFSGLCFSD